MSYVVSARKYRPARFDEVVGQQHVSQTLKKALQTDHLAHAFLFCGPRGVGKTTCARILAKVLNCQHPTADFEPCGTCDNCRSFQENASFNIMELDAASNNSVDHIRALVEQVRFQPQQGRYKIFIIDEVHMLSQSAFNAFLKTLEEPPSYAIFILATTEKHKIIPTILSRCQIYDFKRIQISDIVAHLSEICNQEKIQAEPEALHIIAQKADGAFRDALSIFDRIVSFSGDQLSYTDVIASLNVLDYEYYFRFTDALLAQDLQKVLLIFDEVTRNGFEGDLFVNGLAEHLRNLLVCKDRETLRLLEVGPALQKRYFDQSAITPASFILTALNLANECDVNYKMARNKQLHVEMALIKMAYISQAVQLTGHPQAVAGETSHHQVNPEKKTADLSQSNPAALVAEPALTVSGENIDGIKESAGSEQQPETAQVPDPKTVKNPEEEVESFDDPETGPVEEMETEEPLEDDWSTDADSEELYEAEPAEADLIAEEEELPAAQEVEPDPAESSPSRSLLRKSKSSGLPTLQSLASMHAEIQDEEANDKEVKQAKLTLDDLKKAWSEYIEQSDKGSVKTILNGADVKIENEEVVVVVGSALAESTVRQENQLMDFLRERLYAPRLAMKIQLDPSRSNAAPAKPKKLTDSEKFWKMKTVNPLVDEVRKRFDLRLDGSEP